MRLTSLAAMIASGDDRARPASAETFHHKSTKAQKNGSAIHGIAEQPSDNGVPFREAADSSGALTKLPLSDGAFVSS
jgi:hypothetical protein